MNQFVQNKEIKSVETGYRLLSRLEDRFEVNLRELLFDDSKSLDVRKQLVAERLLEAVAAYHIRHGTEWAAAGKASQPGDLSVEPNPFFTAENAKGFASLRGDEIEEQLTLTSKRLADMLESKSYTEAALYCFLGGLVGVQVAGASGFLTAIAAGNMIEAVATGLRWTKNSAIATVVMLVVMFLFFFVFMRPAKLLGLVINRTSNDFVVRDYKNKGGDLYINTGKMTAFMNDNKDIGKVEHDQEKVQIHKMLPAPEVGAIVFGGWYFAEKHEGAWKGADGAMLFTSEDKKVNFAHQYAVPFSKKNGTNICMIDNPEESTKAIFKRLRPKQSQNNDFTDGRYTLTSCVNSVHGQEVSLIASITDNDDPLNSL